METAELAANRDSASLSAAAVDPLRPSAAAAGIVTGDREATRNFGSLAWTYRGGFDRVLNTVGSDIWGDPAAQGWTLVKENSCRHVWRAVINGSAYYLKYYRRGGRLDTLKRWLRGPACRGEWNGGIYALRHQIPAARPLAFVDGVRTAKGVCSLLITEAVEPAYPLCDFWQSLMRDDDQARRRRDVERLTELLAEMIARAHQAGFEHIDMHAANILVQPLGQRRYRTVFIDLQSARMGTALSDEAVVRNLAQLNQWFRRQSTVGERLRFLRAYWRWRNELDGQSPHSRALGVKLDELVAALEVQADRHARRLWAQRDRRAMRNGRYFARVKLADGWKARVVVAAKPRVGEPPRDGPTLDRKAWKTQLASPLSWFDADRATALKKSHSGMVSRALLSAGETGLPVIVKRPVARDWRRALRMMLGESRSMRGWRVGHAMLHRDIPAARPLAVLERRVGPFVVDSVLLTEAVPGGRDLESFLRSENERLHRGKAAAAGSHASARDAREWRSIKLALTDLLVRELRNLHDRGFVHRDCKASNILIADRPTLRMHWIDMDGIRMEQPARADELQALMRLHVSLLDVPGLTRTDRARFLKAYLARFGASHLAWRDAWRALAPLAERKQEAKEARRKWKLENYGRE